jgi:hypothetical protein
MRPLKTLPITVFVALLLTVPNAFASVYGTATMPRDYIREEVMRLINGDRAYFGLSAMKLDTFLAAKAQDSPVRCPNDATKLNQGRAVSVAAQNVIPAPHALPLCPKYTVLDTVPYWGYSGYRAEILAVDNQDMSIRRYDFGCAIGSQLTCSHSSYTYAPFTAAQAVREWMNSSTHRAKMLGSYSRIGCGAAQGGNAVYGGYTYVGTRWFACIFANTGPTSYKDTVAPTLSGFTVNGVPYVAGMTVGASSTMRFVVTDTGGPTPRVSDWWAYTDGNSDRTRAGFREGAFDAVGSTATVSFSEDLSTFTNGAHTLTVVGRGMDTRTVSVTLSVNLVK